MSTLDNVAQIATDVAGIATAVTPGLQEVGVIISSVELLVKLGIAAFPYVKEGALVIKKDMVLFTNHITEDVKELIMHLHRP